MFGGWVEGGVLHPSNWLVVQVGTQIPVFRKEAAILGVRLLEF